MPDSLHTDPIIAAHSKQLRDMESTLNRLDSHMADVKANLAKQTEILMGISGQQATINSIEKRVSVVEGQLDELWKQKRQVEIIAVENKAYIDEHKNHAATECAETLAFRKDVTDRLLAIERAIDIVGFTKSKFGQVTLLIIAALILLNTYINLTEHWPTVKRIWELFK